MSKFDMEFLIGFLSLAVGIISSLLHDIKKEIEQQGNRITAALDDNRDFLREIDQSLDQIKSARSESD